MPQSFKNAWRWLVGASAAAMLIASISPAANAQVITLCVSEHGKIVGMRPWTTNPLANSTNPIDVEYPRTGRRAQGARARDRRVSPVQLGRQAQPAASVRRDPRAPPVQ